MKIAEIEQIRSEVLPLRKQMALRNEWLSERLDQLLWKLMTRTGIDLWVVVCREYNEDPVVMSLLPAPAMTVRRRTMLLFWRRPEGTVERLSLDRYGYPGFYEGGWNPDEEPDQYKRLAELIQERDPQTIGLNFSETFAFGDGLSWQEHGRLAAALGDELMGRVVSADKLCVGWLERRISAEIELYRQMVRWGHLLIKAAFSYEVITAGETTTDDVVWWMRHTMQDLGLQAWFQPSVAIQAKGQRFDAPDQRNLIQAGDLLHCDVGFLYMGLATDQQQHAYMWPHGTKVVPPRLEEALRQGNRLQEIHVEQMQLGRTGNEVLAAVLAQGKREGLSPTVYSHPLGNHGHGAGPTIGLWDQQDGVKGNGDYMIYDNTCYSIELNVLVDVSEWEQTVRIALEEDGVMQDGLFSWLDERQTRFHLIY